MTSELSNALNPHVVPHRRRRTTYTNSEQHASTSTAVQPRAGPASAPLPPPPAPPRQPYARHRSELELAVVEPPPPPPPPPPAQPPAAPVRTFNPIHELARAVVATRNAAEHERTRRMAWEQEQEARYMQRQAELEKQLADVRAEMSLLKTVVSLQHQQQAQTQTQTQTQQVPMLPQGHVVIGSELPPLPAPTAHIEPVQSPPSDQDSYAHDWSSSPISPPLSNAQPPLVPAFVEGSSNRPYTVPSPNVGSSYAPTPNTLSSPASGWMTSPSPGVPSPSAASSVAMLPGDNSLGKRRTPPPASSPGNRDDASSSDESEAPATAPKKRRNGHDTRCLTIQAAVRTHIYRCMQTRPSEALPDNHIEGAPLGEADPVRFVWAKTAKKSAHNAQMKRRVVADLLARRRKLYKHVPESDFDEATLDAAFDQAFTTLRQKFKVQQDAEAAEHSRWREEQKALKSRRKERKKSKLTTRTDGRARLPAYAHPTFDGALQLECMSSEESEAEYTAPSPSGGPARVRVLRVRTLPWRSTRLLRLFAALDDAPFPYPSPPATAGIEPERKRRRRAPTAPLTERSLGPPKDGLVLPPNGVSWWMVSRRWMRECALSGQPVEELVRQLVDERADEGFDWDAFGGLGGETEEEVEEEEEEERYVPRSQMSYSLANALQAPM